MQSILGGAVMSLFLIALYAPWFSNASMLVAIVVSVLVNIFLMAGCMEMLPPHGVCITAFRLLHRQSNCQSASL